MPRPFTTLTRRVLVLGLLIAFASLSTLGCGGGKSKTSVVSGKVNYKGAPVTGGTMQFHSSAAGAASIPGTINADGTYSFGGVPPGEYTVTVETESIRMASAAYDMKGKTLPPGAPPPPASSGAYVAIPRKYTDPKQSPLKCTVSEDKQAKDFELN